MGLEYDKLSAEATTVYYKNYFGRMFDVRRPAADVMSNEYFGTFAIGGGSRGGARVTSGAIRAV